MYQITEYLEIYSMYCNRSNPPLSTPKSSIKVRKEYPNKPQYHRALEMLNELTALLKGSIYGRTQLEIVALSPQINCCLIIKMTFHP